MKGFVRSNKHQILYDTYHVEKWLKIFERKINKKYHFVMAEEGSYLPSNRNSPKTERIENAPLAILISTEQF